MNTERKRKIAKLKNSSELFLFREIEELQQKISKIDLNNVLASVRGQKGEKGDPGKDGFTPIKGVNYTDGKDGESGKDGKDGKDGYTPTKVELKKIIEPLIPNIPDVIHGKDYILTDKDKEDISVIIGAPDISSEYIRDKLELLEDNFRLSSNAIFFEEDFYIDYKHIKNLPAQKVISGGNGLTKQSVINLINENDKKGVEQYANLSSFPTTGNSNILYIAQDTNIPYRWDGSAYVVVGDGDSPWTENGTDVYVINRDVGIGDSAPRATLDISSGNSPESDLSNDDLYQIRVRNSNGATGNTSGIGFTVSGDNSGQVGAAIIHERRGGNSQGDLTMYTKRVSTADADAEEHLRLSDDGSTTFNDTYTIPGTDGNVGDVLRHNGFGDVSWSNQVSQNEDDISDNSAVITTNFNNISSNTTSITTNTTNISTNTTNIATNTAKVSADGSIDTHSDVDTSTTAPTDGQVLSWNTTNSNWEPADQSGGGGTPAGLNNQLQYNDNGAFGAVDFIDVDNTTSVIDVDGVVTSNRNRIDLSGNYRSKHDLLYGIRSNSGTGACVVETGIPLDGSVRYIHLDFRFYNYGQHVNGERPGKIYYSALSLSSSNTINDNCSIVGSFPMTDRVTSMRNASNELVLVFGLVTDTDRAHIILTDFISSISEDVDTTKFNISFKTDLSAYTSMRVMSPCQIGAIAPLLLGARNVGGIGYPLKVFNSVGTATDAVGITMFAGVPPQAGLGDPGQFAWHGYRNSFNYYMAWGLWNGSNVMTEHLYLWESGRFGIATGSTEPTSKLHVNDDRIRIEQSFTPTGTADTSGNVGDWAWDDDYRYVKTSTGWKRSALSTF